MISSQKKWIALGTENLGRGSHRYPRPLTPPQGKNRAPCGGLAFRERERERERLAPLGAEKRNLLAAGGLGWVLLGSEGVFYDNFGAQTFFFVENLGS